jgi:hemoglobin
MDDVGIVDPLCRVLHDYFTWTTTTTMSAYPDHDASIPEDLCIPRWSWNGLQS